MLLHEPEGAPCCQYDGGYGQHIGALFQSNSSMTMSYTENLKLYHEKKMPDTNGI
jgi:hypothetical protein